MKPKTDNTTVEQPNFFIDDVVCLRAKKQWTGTITRVSWIDDDEDDSEEEEVPLEENGVEVLWNDSRTSEVHHNKLKLIDRALLHGDIVASVLDPQGQTGSVVDVILSVDLKMTKSSQKIPNVFCRYLTDVHPFVSGRHVTLKNPPKLVGTVEEVFYNVEVKFPNGSVCLVQNISQDYLRPEDEGEDDVTSYTYYPSQKVSAPARVWTSAEWLSKGNPRGKTKKKKFTSGVVTKVTPVSVVVTWIIQSEEPVDEVCNPDDLIVLNTFRNTKYEVGDRLLIHPTVKSHFIARNKEQGGKFPIPSSDKVAIHEQLMALVNTWEGSEADCAIVTCTHTFVRVQWQDGSLSGWTHSTDLIPRDHLLDCDFWPGDFILDKERQTSGGVEKAGVVSRVNFQDKTAVVKWILDGHEGVGAEEEVSLYDIGEHPDFQFRLGGVVLSLVHNDVGEVIDLCGDSIRVSWSGDYVSTEKSITLKAVDTSDDEMSYEDDEDDGDDDDEEDGNDDDNGDDDDDRQDVDDSDRQDVEEDDDSDSDVEVKKPASRCPSLLSFATSSLAFLTKIITYGKTGNTNKNKRRQPPKVRHEKSKQPKPETERETNFSESNMENMETEEEKWENEETKEKNETKSEKQESDHERPVFDLSQQHPGVTQALPVQEVLPTQDYPSFLMLDQENGGHHYSVLSQHSQFNNKIARIISKEWKTLQDVLPHNIYVVTYSNRMELLKVLIIGPVNTIYYNSYFIFDICLPADYPLSPPKVFYHSGGYRLHPNLYEDGTVCLSLLGTWSGSQQEQWVPHQSSLLQLFVSIQGLILGVKEPYFLEAGYEKQRGTKQGIQSSGIYNEKALLISLKRMLQNFQNPPPEFREVITRHFSHYYQDVVTLVNYCESLLNNTCEGGNEFEEIKDKYYLPESPSRGLLQPIVKDFKVKFEVEIAEMLKGKGE